MNKSERGELRKLCERERQDPVQLCWETFATRYGVPAMDALPELLDALDEAERKLAEAEQAISALGKAAADSYDCGIRP